MGTLADPMDGRRLLAAIAALVIVLSGLALWIQARDSDAEGDQSPVATEPASTAFQAMVRRGLAEGDISSARQWQPFSGVRSVAGGVRPRTRLAISETLGGRTGLDSLGLEFGRAHRARTPSGVTLWMVPGRGVMCLVRAERLAITCASKSNAIDRGLILQIRRALPGAKQQAFMAIGVVPDWANGIKLQAGRVPITLPVRANAFDFSATRSIKVLQLTR